MIWNPENGEIFDAVLYEFVGDRVHMPLELEPAGSVFVVFRKIKYKSIIIL
jgi:(4-O-methyl)-D-glucuronate---lignin esterase